MTLDCNTALAMALDCNAQQLGSYRHELSQAMHKGMHRAGYERAAIWLTVLLVLLVLLGDQEHVTTEQELVPDGCVRGCRWVGEVIYLWKLDRRRCSHSPPTVDVLMPQLPNRSLGSSSPSPALELLAVEVGSPATIP